MILRNDFIELVYQKPKKRKCQLKIENLPRLERFSDFHDSEIRKSDSISPNVI